KFISSTSGQIMMFSPVARQLLEILGKDCDARGVFTTEQLPDAIRRLRQASATPDNQAQASPPAGSEAEGGDSGEPPVGLGQRAFPMIELFERTLADEGYVLWEAPGSFGER
ncbi:MAG TPA: DUF1840 domain-containing protein, partial [Accumulibacter sp.]|nr:DUF1840 domain-containing protein [Accumulibacter sp.]